MMTLTDLLRWRAELHPDSIALVDERGDQATYGELVDRIERCARRWRDRGVSPGDVVALLDTNSVPFAVNLFGLSRLGAIAALLNWRLTPAEHEALFKVVQPVAVAAGLDLIDRLPSDLPRTRVSIQLDVDPPTGWTADAATADNDLAGGHDALPYRPRPEDPFAIGFSSGTTGRPKGIPLRHESLARSALIDGAEIAGMHLGARQIMVAPMFHLAGLSNSLMGLARGAELHLRTRFDPARILDDIEQLGASYMTVVPAMFTAIVAAGRQREPAPDTSSMLEMSYGASPIAPELVREISDLFPGSRLRQFYGMTEIAGALTTLTPADHDPAHAGRRSAGRVNPGFEVRLVDREGHDVADGAPGEILVRGSSVMHGYWNDLQATAEALVDGWFATGDIATRSDGYLTIMDRAKDMVVSGGENVYPAEVEAVLYEHDAIADVAIIGVPDDHMGERVHAVIATRDGQALDLDTVQTFCRDRLAGYKLPRSVELVAELPRNATGKILKRELRVPHWKDESRSI